MHSPLISLNYYLSSIEHLLERLLVSSKKDQSKRRKGTIFGKILFSTKPINRHTASDILYPLNIFTLFSKRKNWISISTGSSSRFEPSRDFTFGWADSKERGGRDGVIESTCERGERKKGRKKKKRKEKFRRTLLVSRPRSVNGRSSLRSRDYRLIAAKRGSLFCRDVTSSPCRRHRRPLPLFPCFHLSARPLLFPEFELTPRFLLPASLVDHPFPSPLSLSLSYI